MCILVMLVPTHPIPMLCGWKNAHSCTLPGPKIGGDCDYNDQKALFKKGRFPQNPGHCKALLGAHQSMVHPGHWLSLSSVAPQVLIFVVGDCTFLHLVWAGLAPNQENCPIMIMWSWPWRWLPSSQPWCRYGKIRGWNCSFGNLKLSKLGNFELNK